MSKYFHIIILILGFTVSTVLQVKAQFLDDDFCGTREVLNLDVRKKPWKGANSFLYEYLEKINYSETKDSVRYLVPLKFWIYENKDGSIGLADSSLKRFMNNLNYYQELNKTGFRYYIREVHRFNKNKHLELGYFLEAPWQTMVHKGKGCVNVYVTQIIKKRVWGDKYMVRGTYNMMTDAVLLQYNISSTSLSHEIGHYFGLLHPHRNYNKGKAKQESVSRTRTFNGPFKHGLICEKNGDGLADTPAEPKLSHLVDNDCHFVGTSLKDRWGDYYQSHTDNIMSYPTHYRCRKIFTKGQKSVMLYSASQNKYAQNWTTANPENKVYQFDKYEPDNSWETASNIVFGETQEHTFHQIFVPKNKELLYDKDDWLQFETEDAKGKTAVVSLKILNGNLLNISVFDENMHLLVEKQKVEGMYEAEIELKSNIKSKYYIHIYNQKKPLKQAILYQISLKIL